MNPNDGCEQLTIRQHMACEMVKGLLASKDFSFVRPVEGGVCVGHEFLVDIALQLTDTLIEKLSKE